MKRIEGLAAFGQLELAKAETKLLAALQKVDARALLTSYTMYRMVGMAKESTADHGRPAPAAVELAAFLLMPHFGEPKAFDGESIQAGIDALTEYLKCYSFCEVFSKNDDPADAETNSLHLHLRLHSGVVRGTAYPGQVEWRITRVFSPFEADLSALAGIGPTRSVEIAKALLGQMEDNIEDVRVKARTMIASKEKEYRSHPEQRDRIGREMQKFITKMGCSWVPTFHELAVRLKQLEKPEWEAFCRLFGLTPDSLPMIRRVMDVQDRPVIFLDADTAFAAHGVVVFDAIFNHFDSLARSHAPLRDSYGRQVSRWMEEETANYFRRIFPAENIIANACYPDPDQPGGEAEADLLVQWGPFLILAESKGRVVDQEAFRTGGRQLKNAIAKNIEDGFTQTQRFVRALEASGSLTVKEKATNRTIKVDRSDLRRIMPISVTLQHLAGIPTQLAVTKRLGLFKGDAFPWSVCMDDLDVITRFSGSADVFLHYLERRIAHQKLELGIKGDELEIFGQYLDNRLHPDVYENRKELRTGQENKVIAFTGGDERFEPVYVAEWYGTEPPEEPIELDVPDEVRAVLNELRDRSDYGARWIAFALLGLNNSTLVKLASALRELGSRNAVGERMLRITVREGSVVLNIMAHQGLTEREFFQNVTARARIEHYRNKASTTVSIGINQNGDSAFEVAQWLEGEWEYDDELEKVLKADREKPRNLIPSSSFKKPGRNDPCPCGSGLKFKRCCIERIRFDSGRGGSQED
ncbi:MAG: SEC-C domain-containing protein [Verrucomicrobiae bacterium]|nr:SEC-C domain-containing protein [Verrucomicrobiae bacterium]